MPQVNDSSSSHSSSQQEYTLLDRPVDAHLRGSGPKQLLLPHLQTESQTLSSTTVHATKLTPSTTVDASKSALIASLLCFGLLPFGNDVAGLGLSPALQKGNVWS